MRRPWKLFAVIILLTVSAAFVNWPKIPSATKIGSFPVGQYFQGSKIDFEIFGNKITRDLEFKEGLDLAGGTALTLQVDMSSTPIEKRQSDLEVATGIIERRVNSLGVAETNVQAVRSGENYRILVELPGVTDINQAKDLVGKTAQLELRELTVEAPTPLPCEAIVMSNTKPTGINGADFKSAQADFQRGQNGQALASEPVVNFTLTDDGSKKFADLTKRLTGKQLPIFLDQSCISAPVVQGEIPNGSGIISGSFTSDSAKTLAAQLNAGALPESISILEQHTSGASLGDQAVQRSFLAGILGLLMIALFMIGSYGRYGVIATIALFLYSLIVLAVFKLIPVTLSLAGIAGFILSVGMAVDANILIFERLKEELRAGKHTDVATELGFNRAWPSIRDSNISTMVTSVILLYLTSSFVKGFALTLLIGVIISMFTAITVTRTLLRMFLKY